MYINPISNPLKEDLKDLVQKEKEENRFKNKIFSKEDFEINIH